MPLSGGFACTTTAGTQKNHKTGTESKEGNQELSVVRRVEGE